MGHLKLIVYRHLFFSRRLFFSFALFLIYIPKTMADEGLKKAFLNFANQGKSGAKTEEIDNKNFTKMAKDCGLFNKTCTSTDGDITFQKYCGNGKKHINFDTFCKLTDELAAKYYKGDPNASQKFRDLIIAKGNPENHGTKVASGNNVAKMTDTALYTGAHKERFDESGHGKGKEGRENVTANDGYVTGYKGKDTYDKK